MKLNKQGRYLNIKTENQEYNIDLENLENFLLLEKAGELQVKEGEEVDSIKSISKLKDIVKWYGNFLVENDLIDNKDNFTAELKDTMALIKVFNTHLNFTSQAISA